MLQQISQFTASERREKHKLFLRDTMALCTLSGLVIVLSFITYGLFHSFSAHRQMLEARWRARGQAALAAGKPVIAIDDLHSALAYAPDDRSLEIELATALAAAGRTQEAQVYFNTLLESEPGSGIINLELARLAVRQNNIQAAIDHYQAAIDGTWNGDGYTRRRAIRLELAQMLISHNFLPEARNLLLITAANAPEDHPLQLQVAASLLKAGDPLDALDVYHRAAKARQTRLGALEGEANAAAMLGRYLQERNLLAMAISESSFARQPQPTRDAARQALKEANAILVLYPSDGLSTQAWAERIAHLATLAEGEIAACPPISTPASGAPVAASTATAPAAAAPPLKAGSDTQQRQLLAGLAAHLQQLNPLKHIGGTSLPAAAVASTTPSPQDQLHTLAARWTAVPTGAALVKQLAFDPDFASSTLDLIYATAQVDAKACGAPTGEDALLLKIAQSPDQVEAQP